MGVACIAAIAVMEDGVMDFTGKKGMAVMTHEGSGPLRDRLLIGNSSY